MMFMTRWIVLIACLGLWGCSPLSPREAPRASAIYTLDDTGDVARAETPTCRAITVNAVRSAPGFGSSRMVFTRDAHRLEYFAFHKWADSPANMLHGLLVDALEASGRFGAVFTPSSPERGRLRLDTELRTLQQRFDGTASRIELSVRVRLFGNDQVISSRLFNIEEEAGSGPETGVRAANRATVRFLAELLDWMNQVVLPTQPACR